MFNAVKITLSILFFLCLVDMPYGYYQFVRFTAMVGFAILAYNAHESKNEEITIIYIGLAILFQPLIKISLGRELWNVVDVLLGIALLASILIKPKNSNSTTRI